MKPKSLILALAVLAPLAPTLALAAPTHIAACTGVGEDGRIEAAQIPHSLKLVFAQRDGHYLGDVATRITGPGDSLVVEARCEGPWLLADLAPGTYTVAATFQGQTKTRTVQVRQGGAVEAVFAF